MFDVLRYDVPRPVLLLGLAGLLPFAAGALAAWLLPEYQSLAARSQAAYAACILSFLAGLHWGFAFAGYGQAEAGDVQPRRLALACLPPILAWLILLAGPASAVLTLLAGLVLVLMIADTHAAKKALVPAWYPDLRQLLSLAVVLLLGLTLLGVNR